jgi:sec-independent protein translocase protein TatA
MGLDSPLHIILLLAIVLLVFGAKRLPEVGRSLGSGLRGFKESINDESGTATRTIDDVATDEDTHAAADATRRAPHSGAA